MDHPRLFFSARSASAEKRLRFLKLQSLERYGGGVRPKGHVR